MNIKQRTQNCVYVEDDLGDKHCFSYEKEVAAIIGQNYVEYPGPKHDSVTSKQHKAWFRDYYGY